VGSTAQLNVVDNGESAIGKRYDVMKLEETTLRTSSPRTDERALASSRVQTARRTADGIRREPDVVPRGR
jgi:hypothetical protein